MNSYKAKYYNGVTSNSFEVEVILFENYLEIIYESNDENHRLIWYFKSIKESSFLSKNEVTLKYGEFPHQSLEIFDNELINKIHETEIFSSSKKKYGLFIKGGVKTIVIASTLIIFTISLLYFVVVPFVGEKASLLVPQSTEIDLGNSIYENVISAYEIDTAKTNTINRFASNINFGTDYPISITVVNSSEVNAFAIPGGKIVVYSEILKSIQTPEELSALLSHEASHVILQHSLKSMCRSIATGLVLSVLMNDVNGVSAVIIQNADNIKSLSYSRELEEEADINGLGIMINNKIDPKGMLGLFQKLKEANKIDIPEFISTHPVAETRLAYIKKEIDSRNLEFKTSKELQSLFNDLKK